MKVEEKIDKLYLLLNKDMNDATNLNLKYGFFYDITKIINETN